MGQICPNLSSGNHFVSVSDQKGCALNNPQSAMIPVFVPFISEKAKAGFSSIPDNDKPILLERNEIQFINTSTNASVYSWTFDHFGTSTEANPIQVLSDTGLWKVTLYAANEYCSDIYSRNYHIIPNGTIFIASAFSPNNDFHNDTFAPIGAHIVEMEFSIYDRWGVQLFQSNSTDRAWDGTSEGKPAPEGVYTFVLKALLESGVKVQRAGTVTLFR